MTQRINRVNHRGNNLTFFMVLSLLIFATLITVITLFFSTRQVTKGYVVSELESINQDLLRELETHDMEISKVRSLKHIEQSAKYRSMSAPDRVVYVDENVAIASR